MSQPAFDPRERDLGLVPRLNIPEKLWRRKFIVTMRIVHSFVKPKRPFSTFLTTWESLSWSPRVTQLAPGRLRIMDEISSNTPLHQFIWLHLHQ